MNSLCQALCANPVVASTLTHLDLSGNSLRGDDITVFTSPPCVLSLPSGSALNIHVVFFPSTEFAQLPESPQLSADSGSVQQRLFAGTGETHNCAAALIRLIMNNTLKHLSAQESKCVIYTHRGCWSQSQLPRAKAGLLRTVHCSRATHTLSCFSEAFLESQVNHRNMVLDCGRKSERLEKPTHVDFTQKVGIGTSTC